MDRSFIKNQKRYTKSEMTNEEFSRRHSSRGHCSEDDLFEAEEKFKIFRKNFVNPD